MCASIAKLLFGLVDIVYTGQQADNDIYFWCSPCFCFACAATQHFVLMKLMSCMNT